MHDKLVEVKQALQQQQEAIRALGNAGLHQIDFHLGNAIDAVTHAIAALPINDAP